jgi:hypothetical protein
VPTRVKATVDRAVAFFVSPLVQFRANLALAAVWALLFLPGVISWRDSVPFLVFVSIYANFVGHLSTAVASIAARKADPDDPL